MDYRGHVKNGKVVLEQPADLAEGTEVLVRPARTTKTKVAKTSGKTLLERLAPVVGKAKGLPRDFARNHDHYLHGKPKR